MKMIRTIVGALLLAPVLFSCTERIDIELKENFRRIVVDGGISTDTMAHVVKLTTTTNYFYNEEPPVVSEAMVYLDNGREKILLVELPAGSGLYQTPENYFGVPGESYLLEINLKEPIGEKDFFSAQSSLPETVLSIDSIGLEYESVFEIWFVKLYALDPPTRDFYRIDLEVNDLMISDTASRAQVTDDRFFNGNNTNGLTVSILRKDEIAIGDTVTLILSSITEEYYKYFMQLQMESGYSSPLFSGPPANVTSNVNEGGLGFFAAMGRARQTIIVTDEVWQAAGR
jgi:hypothetical protein